MVVAAKTKGSSTHTGAFKPFFRSRTKRSKDWFTIIASGYLVTKMSLKNARVNMPLIVATLVSVHTKI